MHVLDGYSVHVFNAHEQDDEPSDGQEDTDQVEGLQVEVQILTHHPRTVIGVLLCVNAIHHATGAVQIVVKFGVESVSISELSRRHTLGGEDEFLVCGSDFLDLNFPGREKHPTVVDDIVVALIVVVFGAIEVVGRVQQIIIGLSAEVQRDVGLPVRDRQVNWVKELFEGDRESEGLVAVHRYGHIERVATWQDTGSYLIVLEVEVGTVRVALVEITVGPQFALDTHRVNSLISIGASGHAGVLE